MIEAESVDERVWVEQTDLIEFLLNGFGKGAWVDLRKSIRDDSHWLGFYAALLSRNWIRKALNNPSWDLKIGDGHPGFTITFENGKEKVRYDRFPLGTQAEPLIYFREFHGVRPSYYEISEEFKLFHNLHHEPDSNEYVNFDDGGNTVPIIRIYPKQISTKLHSLRQYAGAKRKYIALYVDSVRYSRLSIDEIDSKHRSSKISDGKSYLYHFYADACGFGPDKSYKSFSRVFGKKLIKPLPFDQTRTWPFENNNDEQYPEFIIGYDDDGREVSHSCNPDLLSDYFGGNPGAPHYLTPVYFNSEVLGRYYADPSRYSVEDGYLGCVGLWSLRLDNNHPNYVVVFLGDLGRDLPSQEKVYWRSFNVAPEGGVSEVTFRRAFMGEFAEPTKLDLLFKYRYRHFNEMWIEKYDWPLFRPLSTEDAHLLSALRIPLTSNQHELDEQVLSLTKILIDSLNDQELNKRINSEKIGERSIAKLEQFLKSQGFKSSDQCIDFLRNLQNLRSTGSGHLKGRNYEKAMTRMNLNGLNLRDAFEVILENAVSLLVSFSKHFLDDE